MESIVSYPGNASFLSQQLPRLPADASNVTAVLQPTNGSVFVSGQSAQFILPQNGLLDPETLMVRGRIACVTTGAATGGTFTTLLAAPGLSWCNRMDALCGSRTAQSITDYDVVTNAWIQMKLNTSQRASAAYQLGINNEASTLDPNSQLQNSGFQLPAAAGSTYIPFCVPLLCLLSSSDQLVPLFAMEAWQINLTVNTQTNFINLGTGQTVALSMLNLEICYDQINLGAAYESMVKAMPPFYLRSSSFAANTQQFIGSASSQQVDLSYSIRVSSARSLFLISTSTANTAINKRYDSFDITGSNSATAPAGGTFQFFIDNVAYPQRALDSALQRAGIMGELRNAVYSAQHGTGSFDMSILYSNFTPASIASGSTSQKLNSFIVGTSLEKVQQLNKWSLNGISTKNGNIGCRINCYGATNAFTGGACTLVCFHDVIMTVDPSSKTCQFDS